MRVKAWIAVVGVTAVVATAGQASWAGGDDGELWLPSESGGKVYVVHGMGSVESVSDPSIQKPHLVTFSDDGELAYITDVGNGNLNILDADTRAVTATIPGSAFGGGPDTHQAKPSPDDSILLVSRRGLGGTTPKLFKVSTETWTVTASLAIPGRSPICSVFTPDGAKAYVSLGPSGVAIVDVETMTVTGQFATTGGVACSMSISRDGSTVFVTSNGGPGSTTGYFYRIDTAADTITAPLAVAGKDLHWNVLSPNESRVYVTVRGAEALNVLSPEGVMLGTIDLNATAGADSPDGAAVKGNNVYVALKDSGKLAVVKAKQGTVRYIDVAPAAPSVLPHVTVRP